MDREWSWEWDQSSAFEARKMCGASQGICDESGPCGAGYPAREDNVKRRTLRALTIVSDRVSISTGVQVEEIPISKFRTTCFDVLQKVPKTGKPVLVTRFGKPLAEIVPPHEYRRPKNWVGSLAGTGEILGDIVSRAKKEDDWEAMG